MFRVATHSLLRTLFVSLGLLACAAVAQDQPDQKAADKPAKDTTSALHTPTSISPRAYPAGKLIADASTLCLVRRMRSNPILPADPTSALWKKVEAKPRPSRLRIGGTVTSTASVRK